jgi:lipoprotein-releasing system permease protein
MQSYMGGFLQFFIDRAVASSPSITVTQTAPGLPNPAQPAINALTQPGAILAVQVQSLPVPSTEDELENPRLAEAQVAAIPGVAEVAPYVGGQALALNGDLREPVSYLGIRPLAHARITDFAARMVAGTPEDLARQANGIILGIGLAARLSAGLGDRVTLISPQGVTSRFQVVGLYSAQIEDIDRTRAFIQIEQAQQLRGSRTVTGLEVRTVTLEQATPVARRIEQDTDLTARTWRETNSAILDLFTTISLIIYLVVALTLIVAGFGIANVLVLTVSEKRRDIGVLKAMGATGRQVGLLFLGLGILVGVAGTALGLLAATGIIALLARTPVPFQNVEGLERAVAVGTFPMLRVPRVYLLSAAFGLLISAVAGLLPALRAARSDPLEVIRNAE